MTWSIAWLIPMNLVLYRGEGTAPGDQAKTQILEEQRISERKNPRPE
jgi:hypothetical protein